MKRHLPRRTAYIGGSTRAGSFVPLLNLDQTIRKRGVYKLVGRVGSRRRCRQSDGSNKSVPRLVRVWINRRFSPLNPVLASASSSPTPFFTTQYPTCVPGYAALDNNISATSLGQVYDPQTCATFDTRLDWNASLSDLFFFRFPYDNSATSQNSQLAQNGSNPPLTPTVKRTMYMPAVMTWDTPTPFLREL